MDAVQSNSLETKDESTQSWKLGYSTTGKLNEASKPSFTRPKRKRSKTSQADLDIKKNLENIMKELQELKKVRTNQNLDQDTDKNLLSLKIKVEIVPLTL